MAAFNVRRRLSGGAAALAAAGIALAPSGASAVADSDVTISHGCTPPVVTDDVAKVVCPYSGAAAFWRVPEGVTSVTFDLYGAQGGSQADPAHAAPGGLGAHLHARISRFKPGQVLMIVVGGRPAPGSGAGGFNGGGSARGPAGWHSPTGGGGGGATDVRTGPRYGLASRVLVAGGGGGNGGNSYNWIGGHRYVWAQGASGGTSGQPGCCGTHGGGAAQFYRGGAGGVGGADVVYEQPPSHAPDGSPGALGVGGAAPGGTYLSGGGGGGGGYYGGGGGGAAGRCFSTPEQCAGYTAAGFGGGGGGDYSASAHSRVTDGIRRGNGLVIITYREP
jgi:Glycine rich protein